MTTDDGRQPAAWQPERVLQLLGANDLAAAERAASARVSAVHDDAEAWFLLGTARQRLGREDEARVAFETARRVDPDDPRPRTALGAMLGAAGRPAEALAEFDAALARRPDNPRLLVNAGIALEELGRDDEALARYDRALEIFAGMGDALQNRAALNLRLRRLRAAAEDAERLVALFPGLAAVHLLRAQTALAEGRARDALADYKQACDLQADCAEGWVGQAVTRAILGELAAALAAAERARTLDAGAAARFLGPAEVDARADGELFDVRRIYLVAGWERHQRNDWRGYREWLADFARLVTASAGSAQALRDRALLYVAHVVPLDDGARAALTADVAAEVRRNAHAEAAPFAFTRNAREKLRVGYLSANFRDHVAAQVMLPLLRGHDRRRFEVVGYGLHAYDDAPAGQLAAACDVFQNLGELSDAEAAARIHGDDIDVLVDLSGYQEHGRAEIAAMRPAPVQVSYIGFPGSLGAGICDYRITDRVASPLPDPAFSEALIRLPYAHILCDGGLAVADPADERAAHGLPSDAFVFACHNNPAKIEPGVFALWMRILAAVPRGVLWLLDGGADNQRNLRAAAAQAGIAPARLCFAPRIEAAAYRSRLRHADLWLDTTVYGAHVTANDVLLAGLPMVTRCGASWAGRIGASQASAAGLGELMAGDDEAYVALATALAHDGERLRTMATRLATRRAPLFDTAARVADYERALLAAWERRREGLEPSAIDL